MAVARDGRLRHPSAEVVAGALGKHVAVDGSCFVAHAAGEVAKAKAQARVIEVTGDCARHDSLELPNVGVLAPLVAEVLPRRVAGTDGARNVYGESFVDEKLAQRRPTAGVPVRVVAGRIPR